MKHDVIVIGAGVIGLATAERLLLKGARVKILERSKVGQESSWAGGGILSPLFPWNYNNDVIQLTNYSTKLFPAWTSALRKTTGIDPEYETCGMLMLPPFDRDAAIHWCAKHGINVEPRIIPDSTCHIENYIENANKKTHNQTLLLPDIAQVRNPRLLHALKKRIVQLGGEIIENCTVNQIKTSQRQIQSITSSCGEFIADHYIVCTGAWSSKILGTHALKLNIRPIKGQMLLFKFAKPPVRTILAQNDLYIIPRQDGHLLIGSTLENVGFSKHVTVSARNYLLRGAQNIMPELERMPLIRHWSGLRPGSSNNIPTIGRHPSIRNLYINCGHFRYGVTMAPASAEILVNEIINVPQPLDITPYQAGWNSN